MLTISKADYKRILYQAEIEKLKEQIRYIYI
jgi:hypothetical protein